MGRPHRRQVAVLAVAGVTLLAMANVGAAAGASASVRHAGARPAWATAARDAGHAAAGGAVDVRVWLAFRDAAGVRALAAAVTNPASASYGHYLTPSEFNARYAPTTAQANAVASWLRSAGLRVAAIPASHRYVAATGSVAQAQKAFGTRLDNFRVAGQLLRAPATDLHLPASVASTVAGVTGLDTADHSRRPAGHSSAPAPPAAFLNAEPMSTAYGDTPATFEADGTTALPQYNGATLPYVVRGYTPPTYRTAYGLSGSGAGSTIAIVDAYFSATMISDVNQYGSNHGITPALSAGSNYTEQLAPRFSYQSPHICDASNWLSEDTLDVEAAHGTAPGATIHYFGAASCLMTDLLDALQQATDDPQVDVISNSWGNTEGSATADEITAHENVFLQGTTEGKTFLFASGDNGDELAASGTKQADYPPSDPYVVGVGGTAVAIDSTGAIIGQTGWGTNKATLGTGAWNDPSFLYGSGGGCSAVFTEPSWQASVTTGCNGMRGVPDISMDGDITTGMLIGLTQTFPHHKTRYSEYRVGGTSLASPLFAGVVALVDQAARAAGHQTLAGPSALYRLSSSALTDVVAQGTAGSMPDAGNVRADYANSLDASGGILYSVRTFDQDSSLVTGAGWDQVTGRGTVNAGTVAALAALTP